MFIKIKEIEEDDKKFFELNSVEEIEYQYPNINEVLKFKKKGNDVFKEFTLLTPESTIKLENNFDLADDN